jgi:hypothetical protein
MRLRLHMLLVLVLALSSVVSPTLLTIATVESAVCNVADRAPRIHRFSRSSRRLLIRRADGTIHRHRVARMARVVVRRSYADGTCVAHRGSLRDLSRGMRVNEFRKRNAEVTFLRVTDKTLGRSRHTKGLQRAVQRNDILPFVRYLPHLLTLAS